LNLIQALESIVILETHECTSSVNKEEGRAHNKKEQSQRSELKQYECTCRVYGQTHKCRENQSKHHTLGRMRHQCTCHVYGQIRQWKYRPKWSNQRDMQDEEEPRLGPYRSKKDPYQPQGGPKEKTASDQKDRQPFCVHLSGRPTVAF